MRARLLAIVLVLVAPLNAMVYAVIANLARATDDAQRSSLLYSARSVAAALDGELGKYIALGASLARSPALIDERLDAFEGEARRAFTSEPDAWIVVSDLSGQQLLNTAPGAGAPLPQRSARAFEAQQRALASHSTVVSDVYVGPGAQDWVAAVEIPVFRNGRPFRCLSVIMSARGFLNVFNAKDMPRNWIGAVMDGRARYVARAPDYDSTVGQPVSAGWRASRDAEGVSEFRSREGDTLVNANALSDLSGWAVGIGVKKVEFDAAAARAVTWASFLGAGLSVLSLLLALFMARSITRPIARLQVAAADVLTDPDAEFESGLPEFDQFWTALKRAAIERALNERMVRDSERRLRLASEAARFGVYEFDPVSGAGVWSPEMHRILGVAEDAAFASPTLAAVHADDLAKVKKIVEDIERTIGPYEIECRIVRGDGAVRWALDRGEAVGPLAPTTGKVNRITGTILDITELKQAEERNVLLLREVSHRAKNMLSVVQAIARRTEASNGEEFLKLFGQRIQALAANQDLLIENSWRGIDMQHLARAQFAPFADLIGQRVRLEGPAARLKPDAAQGIGMALHELLTNAGKYGALSTDAGSIELSWSMHDGVFEIVWVERDGPPVAPPRRPGFGTTVISHLARTSVAGHVQIDFARAGLIWRLHCPAGNAIEEAEAGEARPESKLSAPEGRPGA